MKGKIKINGTYGAKIGNIQVFTYERAIDVFKAFVERCYSNLTMESSTVLSNVSDDMHKIGFDYDELQKIEIDFLETI